MNSEWKVKKLSELADINPKRHICKGHLAPFVEMAALPTYSRDIPVSKISSRIFTGGGSKFKNGDTLLARINPCLENGKTAFIANLGEGIHAHGSTEFIVLGPKSASDARFLFYLARSDSFREYTIARMEGTSGRQRVPTDAVCQYDFFCAPGVQREKIGEILGVLDDRISLLRETNATLEAIAQTLFKSWFVDFNPVRVKIEGCQPEGIDAETAALFPDSFESSEFGLVPKGWRITTLAAAYEINPTRKLKKGELAPYLDMANVQTEGHHPDVIIKREMSSGSKFIKGDTLLARITPCLENGKTAFVDFLNETQVGWGSTEFVVLRPKPPLPLYHGYLLSRHKSFREFAIQSMSGTSGRQRIQNDVLGRYLVTIPTEIIAERFGAIVTPIQKKITENSNQAQTLATLRDILLPRLISGQLRLPETEEVIEVHV